MNKFSPLGALQLTIAQVVIGLNLVMAKSMLPHLSMFFILLLRFAFGIMIGLLMNAPNNRTLLCRNDGVRLTKTDHVFLIAQALTAGFLFNAFMLLGMQYTTAASAGLITSIIPAAIAGLSVIFLKEKLTMSLVLSIILAMCGLAILNIHGASFDASGKNLLGQFIILLAVFPEAIFTIIVKMHRTEMSTLNKVIYMNFYNFLMFVPFCLWYVLAHGWPVILPTDWALLFLYGLNSVLFFLMWYKGLQHTSAMISGLYTAVAPCATIVLAYIFLGEPIHLSYIITFVFIFCSIVIGSGLLNRKLLISLF